MFMWKQLCPFMSCQEMRGPGPQPFLWNAFFFFLLLFKKILIMATPTAYGSSWASGQIGAASEAHIPATATPDSSRICILYHSSWHCWILNS